LLQVKFNPDVIDETNLLEETLRPHLEAMGGILDIVSLSGNHITPCVQRWQNRLVGRIREHA
nr:alpha/beta hydrolase fold protein [Tanacetum cinerariifolium]